jgi:hypothetical protein
MKQYLCNDCGVDVLKTGDWYLAHPKAWEDQLGLSCNDNLCIGCLDKRLGRGSDLPGRHHANPEHRSTRQAECDVTAALRVQGNKREEEMKTMILAIAMTLIAAPSFAASTVQRDAPTTRFYDARGSVTGSARHLRQRHEVLCAGWAVGWERNNKVSDYGFACEPTAHLTANIPQIKSTSDATAPATASHRKISAVRLYARDLSVSCK